MKCLSLASAQKLSIGPHENRAILTDLALEFPPGCYGRIASRSGLAKNYCIEVGAGVVDPDYRGNVGILLFNRSNNVFEGIPLYWLMKINTLAS